MIHFKSLSKITNQIILDCFNLAFSDYIIPIDLSLEQLEKKIKTEDIDKEISVGAFKEEKLVGFILHGRRKEKNTLKAYNAGTGVIPSERGFGLTKKMYGFIHPFLISQNISEVVLEVISNNTPAIKSYKSIGFKSIRDLVCYKGELDIHKTNDQVEIQTLSTLDYNLLPPITTISPSWQNTLETIKNMNQDAVCFTANTTNGIVGYAIFNKLNNRLLQIAVKEHMTRQYIGSTLLQHIMIRHSKNISVINIDLGFEGALKFFESIGMKTTITQIEMKWVFE